MIESKLKANNCNRGQLFRSDIGSDMLIFQIRYAAHFLTWFGHDFPAGQFVSVRSFLIATTT